MLEEHIYDSLSMLRGAVAIVYPGGLPPYDPVQEHFDNRETKHVKEVGCVLCWWCVCWWCVSVVCGWCVLVVDVS